MDKKIEKFKEKINDIIYENDLYSYDHILSELKNIMHTLLIPIKRGKPGCIWDGTAHYPEQECEHIFDVGNENKLINCLRHELSHHQVSSPIRRLMKDYGLGQSYVTTIDIKTVIKDPYQEESCATILDILWMHKLGMRDKKYAILVDVLYYENNILKINEYNIERDIKILLDKKVIDVNLNPLVKKWDGYK